MSHPNPPIPAPAAPAAPAAPVQVVDPRTLELALNAMKSLLQTFAFERYVHLLTAAASSGLLFYAIYRLIDGGEMTAELGKIFGASGLATAATARSSYFFRKAFGLIESIIRRMAGT